MKHTHHHFLIGLAIVVTLFVASLYFYMSYSLGKMVSSVIDTRGKVAVLQAKNSVNEKLKKIDTDSVNDWKKLAAVFVPTDNVVPFIVDLESLGDNVGSKVSVTSIGNVAPESGSLASNGYIGAKVTVQGSWSAVLRTLVVAENMPYKVNISNVLVSTYVDAAGKSTDWQLTFDINAIKSI